MPAGAFLKKNAIAISFVLACLRISNAAEPNGTTSRLFQFLTPPPQFNTTRFHAVADALGFKNWPQTNVWRVAPDVNKPMLAHPDKITTEQKSYHLSPFQQGVWASSDWRVDCLAENDKPIPDIPEEVKNKLVQGLAPELKNDPNFVKKYLEERTEKYRQAQKYRIRGSLEAEIHNTPSSKAAQESLLVKMSITTREPNLVIGEYSKAEKMGDLGTMIYIIRNDDNTNTSIDFIRDNILVTIRGDGELTDEALPLARKIDSAILKGPELTYEQLIARRPVLSISGDIKKDQKTKQKSVSYSFIAPNDVNIVDARTVIRGQNYGPVKDNNIILPRENGPADIKLTAITNELLVGQCEKTIDIPDVNTGADF